MKWEKLLAEELSGRFHGSGIAKYEKEQFEKYFQKMIAKP
jgi:tyrosyl-tRNA synthetase